MKKFALGLALGLSIAIPIGAHAEVVSLVNQVVQNIFPVTVDGKSMGDAIVVDNKTYLPVREFGESVGYNVTFTQDSKVILNKKQAAVNQKYERYLEVVKESSRLVNEKLALEDKINVIKTTHATMDQNVDDLKQKVADLQVQIDKLDQEKHALEATNFK